MQSYIARNYKELKKRHYVINARIDTYFFAFSYAKTCRAYLDRFGEDFCFVINHADTHDDAYVMPYRAVAGLFAPEHLAMHDGHLRWVGKVEQGTICLNPGNRRQSVTAFFNAFEHLGVDGGHLEDAVEVLPESFADDGRGDAHLWARIRVFNDQYREAIPQRRRVLSELVARPGVVTDHLKRLRDYCCQLCGVVGFRQANGVPYIEAHHLMELHHLLPGSYCSDNIVIVCATCHRKLHYALVTYRALDSRTVEVCINGMASRFSRNTLTTER